MPALKPFYAPLPALAILLASHCAQVYAGGNLRSFGSNGAHQLGIGSDWVEGTEPAATDVVSASAGAGTVFYMDSAGTTWAAGDNRYGQLGLGLYRDAVLEFTPLEGDYSEVFPDHLGTFFLKQNGDLHYAGVAEYFFLGGFRGRYASPIPVLTNVKRVDAHGSSVAFVFNDGSVRIMADSFANRFGFGYHDAPRPPMDKPVLVAEGAEDALIAGHANVVLLSDDGTLAGVGSAYGHSNADGLVEPVVIDTGVVAISRSGSSSFSYLKADGAAYYWFNAEVVLPMAESGAVSIFGSSYVAEDGTQWRVNFQATLNAQGDVPLDWTSLHMEESETVEFVSASSGVNAILRESGELYIDGDSPVAAGLRPETDLRAPHFVDTDVKQVMVSEGLSVSTFYIKDDGTLWAAGSNHYQKTGVPGSSRYESPVLVMQNIAQVSADSGSAFAIDNDGALWGMGRVLDYSFLSRDPEVLAARRPAVLADGVVAVSAKDDTAAYVKNDGTLWLLGSNVPIQSVQDEHLKLEDPIRLADDAVGVANTGAALFWIDNGKTLWGLGLHAYHVDDNDGEPRKIAEDVVQVIGVPDHEAAFFITSSNELWSYGSQAFSPDSVTVPALVDSDVIRVSVAGIQYTTEVYYQKTDGTLWYSGYDNPNYPYGSPTGETPDMGVPFQVFVGEDILGFAYSYSNFMIITADNAAPSFVEQPQDAAITLGESATLTVETDGGYSGYVWYEGATGDRSQPLRRSGIAALTVSPYETTSYWVEAYNANGTAASESATVTVADGLSGEYRDWAEWWDLHASQASPSSNRDRDLYTNFEEYVLDLDPYMDQDLPVGIEFDPSNSTFYLSRRPNPLASESLIFSISKDLANWTDLPAGEPHPDDENSVGQTIPVPPQEIGNSIFIQYRIQPSQ